MRTLLDSKVCANMFVCVTHLKVHTQTHTHTHTHTLAHTYTHTHAHTCTHTQIHEAPEKPGRTLQLSTPISVDMKHAGGHNLEFEVCVYLCVCLCVCACVCAYLCVCVGVVQFGFWFKVQVCKLSCILTNPKNAVRELLKARRTLSPFFNLQPNMQERALDGRQTLCTD